MTYIEPRHYKIVADILAGYAQYEFFVFGSRARGDAHQYSDLDLCCMQSIPRSVISDIKEQFDNSRLPYKVDIVDFTKASDEFRELIKDDLIRFQEFSTRCVTSYSGGIPGR
jgi:type I restriction enzyme S subunit